MKDGIKILSYNLHLGLSAFRKASIEERLIQTIRREQFDIVLLQELWLPENAVMRSLLDQLEDTWDYRICGPTFRFATGIQGNGLLSSFPITAWQNQSLTCSTKQQPRAILHADLTLADGQTAAVICTHFGLQHGERLDHARELAEYIHQHIPPDRPLLLAGDFNDWPCKLSQFFAKELDLLEVFKSTHGRHQRTFPAIFPVLCLDRIYARGFGVKDARVVHEAGWFASSDHLPLAATLTLH